MTQQREILNLLYSNMAKELDISEDQFEKAEISYNSIGEWIGTQEEHFDVRIFPQGSFNLGTVIRPINDKDEYDIDLVCLLLAKTPISLSAAELKRKIGSHIKSHETYNKMLDAEGKRCWKLQYKNYHMDILPATPASTKYPANALIQITNKDPQSNYSYQLSNPEAYKNWFFEQANKILDQGIREDFIKAETEIEKIPRSSVKMPLQRVVQILKRHRDIMYQTKNDVKPISCIITTLSAQAYHGETNIYDALHNIIMTMDKYIEEDSGTGFLKISNPVMPDENFADKWQTEPEKQKEFFSWLRAIKEELLENLEQPRTDIQIKESFEKSFGKNITSRALTKYSERPIQGLASNPIMQSFDNTEQFIEGLFEVKICQSLTIDGQFSQSAMLSWQKMISTEYFKLPQNRKLRFSIISTSVVEPYDIYWKVLNIGQAAEKLNQIRGQIINTNKRYQEERTSFPGNHYVECYIVKDGICVARDKITVPIANY